jgi:Fe-S-cluster containining protein
MDPVSTAAELDALYAELPTIDCQGHCWDSCGPIFTSTAEHDRIAKAGVEIRQGSFLRDGPSLCPALGMFHQCTVYDIRPMICRLWGLSRRLRCNYGCQPSRVLSEPEMYELLARAFDISGQHDDAAMTRLATLPENQEHLRQAHAFIDEETEAKWREIGGHR